MFTKEQMDVLVADLEVRHGFVGSTTNQSIRKYKKNLRKSIFKMYKNKSESLYRLTLWMRMVSFTRKRSLFGLISRIQYQRYKKKFQVKISCSNIGKGLHIVHDSNCYINAERIGNFFTIYQGATIGSDRGGSYHWRQCNCLYKCCSLWKNRCWR